MQNREGWIYDPTSGMLAITLFEATKFFFRDDSAIIGE